MKNLLLFLIPIIFFTSCNSKEEKINDKKSVENIEKPIEKLTEKQIADELKSIEESHLKISDSLLEKSVFVEKTENGLTRIWVKSNEKRDDFFYSDTLNVLKISQYKFDHQKLNLIKEIDLEKTEWAYLEIDSANIKTKKIGKNNYVFLTHQVSNMGKAVSEQSVIFSMINVENIAENFNLQYFGYPSDYCKECIRGNFIENSKLKSSKKQFSFLILILHQLNIEICN